MTSQTNKKYRNEKRAKEYKGVFPDDNDRDKDRNLEQVLESGLSEFKIKYSKIEKR